MTGTQPDVASATLARMAVDDLRRDRLLSSLTLILGCGILMALPFVLQAGASFFMPLTAALVIAVALVPLLEWLERCGVPATVAAAASVLAFLAVVNAALALVILPASGWFARLPQSVPRIQANIAPLVDFYRALQDFVGRTLQSLASGTEATAQAMAATAPPSVLDYVISAAPNAAIQLLFILLVIYFFLSGWAGMRRVVGSARPGQSGASPARQLLQNVVDSTANYLATITVINALLGLMVSLLMGMIGMPSPLMWGGIVALCNYIPYLGPVLAAFLLALGGLMTFDDLFLAFLPAMIFIAVNLVEAYFVTPMILGRRLTLNPLWILISLSFWGWIWGATGALLAVPLLLVVQAVLSFTGTPNLSGFLFDSGTLARAREREPVDFVGG